MTGFRVSKITRRRRIAHGIAAAGLMAAIAVSASAQQQTAQVSAGELLGRASHLETGEGDLPAAIAMYRRVIAHPEVDSLTRLQTELRLATLLERTGDTDGARRLLEGIVSAGSAGTATGDVTDAARERLASLAESEPTGASQYGAALPPLPASADTGGGFDYTVSPDGRYGLFTAYRMDSQNVGLFEYETEKIVWVTSFPSRAEAAAESLMVSPDGNRVAYSVGLAAEGAAEIHVATLGEPADVVYRTDVELDGPMHGSPIWLLGWTADDELIGHSPLPNRWKTLFKLELATGDYTQIASVDWRGMTDPRVSPDGRFLAIRTTADGSLGAAGLHVLAVDGTGMTHLTDQVSGEVIWSRDGRHVLFVSDRHGARGLWAIPVENGEGTGPPILLRSSFPGSDLAWAGEQLSYLDGWSGTDAFTVSLDVVDGEDPDQPRRVSVGPGGSSTSPHWSSRGDLAVVSTRDGRARLVILHADGSTTERWMPDELEGNTAVVGFNTAGTVVGVNDGVGIRREWTMPRRMALYEIESDRWSIIRIPGEQGPWQAMTTYAVFRGERGGYVFYYPAANGPDFRWRLRRFDARSGEVTTVYTNEPGVSRPRLPLWLSPDGAALRFADSEWYRELNLADGTVKELMVLGDDLDSAFAPVSSAGGSAVVARLGANPTDRKFQVSRTGVCPCAFRVFDLDAGTTRDVMVPTDLLFGQFDDDYVDIVVRTFALSSTGDQLAFVGRIQSAVRRYLIEDPLTKVLDESASR